VRRIRLDLRRRLTRRSMARGFIRLSPLRRPKRRRRHCARCPLWSRLPVAAPDPGEEALDNPGSRLDGEADLIGGLAHGLEGDRGGAGDALASVAGIGEDALVAAGRRSQAGLRGRTRRRSKQEGAIYAPFTLHLGAIAGSLTRLCPDRFRILVWPSITALVATRIMLLAHYVSDVVAGLMLGVAIDKLVGRLFNSVRATLIAKL
jgi:hypothetical protein